FDIHLGGRDVRILLDRQRRDAADPGEHDNDGNDPGEDRPVDEDARQHQLTAGEAAPGAPATGPGPAGAPAGHARTGAPGVTLPTPSTITRSPAASPSVTTQLSPWTRSATTAR